jgi:hypothetical protein
MRDWRKTPMLGGFISDPLVMIGGIDALNVALQAIRL